jgi:predicted DNA-binding transcriptional regulator AlpA
MPTRTAQRRRAGAATAAIQPAYLDTPAAALYLSLSASQLEQQRAAGKGPPFVRFGRSVRYRREDLDRWADARRVVPLAARVTS